MLSRNTNAGWEFWCATSAAGSGYCAVDFVARLVCAPARSSPTYLVRVLATFIIRWLGTQTLPDGAPYENHGVHIVRMRWGKVVDIDANEDSQLVAESLKTAAAHGIQEALAEPILRVGHGFRNFDNYRLRLLLHCGITWHHQIPTPLRGRLPRLAA
jgi:hypothetical protein